MPFHVTCVCGQRLVVPDDRSGDVVRCTACARELAIPEVQAPLPPPVPDAPADDGRPAIRIDMTIGARPSARVDPGRRLARTIGWCLALLSAISVLPVAIALWRSHSIALERWALGLLILAALQLSYAVYLVQLPDWSSMRVVSIVTLGIAALYAVLAGMRMLAAPGNSVLEALELEGNLFSSRQQILWCFAMMLLTSSLSYLAGRASGRWSREALKA